MKWKLHPENEEITTTLPLTIEVHAWKGKPRVFVHGLGNLELKKQGANLKTEFYFTLPGKYRIDVRDSVSHHTMDLEVKEHQYLSFNGEFGFFFILFLVVMGGIVLWTRKIMHK